MKVEKKVQRTGGGTPYVYLPKKWARELFPQDLVAIQRLPLGLFLTPPSAPVDVANYRINDESAREIKEALLSAYTQGHREVRATFPPQAAKVTSEVSRFAARLIGVVAEVGNGEVRLREYTEHERVDLTLLIRGLFSKCREMAGACRDLLRVAGEAQLELKEGLGALERIEDDADFLSFGLFRLLSSRSRYVESPGEELVTLLFYSIINYAAERYCDALFGVAGAVREMGDQPSGGKKASWASTISRLAAIPNESLHFLEKAEKVVLNKDGRSANALREEVHSRRRKSWEPAVVKVIQTLASPGSASIMYPATEIGSRLLESGTYLESFCSRTSQFHFAQAL